MWKLGRMGVPRKEVCFALNHLARYILTPRPGMRPRCTISLPAVSSYEQVKELVV